MENETEILRKGEIDNKPIFFVWLAAYVFLSFLIYKAGIYRTGLFMILAFAGMYCICSAIGRIGGQREQRNRWKFVAGILSFAGSLLIGSIQYGFEAVLAILIFLMILFGITIPVLILAYKKKNMDMSDILTPAELAEFEKKHPKAKPIEAEGPLTEKEKKLIIRMSHLSKWAQPSLTVAILSMPIMLVTAYLSDEMFPVSESSPILQVELGVGIAAGGIVLFTVSMLVPFVVKTFNRKFEIILKKLEIKERGKIQQEALKGRAKQVAAGMASKEAGNVVAIVNGRKLANMQAASFDELAEMIGCKKKYHLQYLMYLLPAIQIIVCILACAGKI